MVEQPWRRARRPWTLIRFTEYGYEYCPIAGLCPWYDWREVQYRWPMRQVKGTAHAESLTESEA